MWYFVHRIFYKFSTGDTRSSSIECFKGGDRETNRKQALKRYYSIIASDIDNDDISYEQVQMTDDTGAVHYTQIFDNRTNE